MRKIVAVTAVLAFMMCAGLTSRAQEATSETIANANAAKESHRSLTGRCTPTGWISRSTNSKMERKSTPANIR